MGAPGQPLDQAACHDEPLYSSLALSGPVVGCCSAHKVPRRSRIVSPPRFDGAEHRGGRILNPRIQSDLESWAKGRCGVRSYIGEDRGGASLDRTSRLGRFPDYAGKNAPSRLGKSAGRNRIHPYTTEKWLQSYGGLAQR
jgi:hypothetical protein